MNEFIQNLLDFSQLNQEHIIVGVALFMIIIFLIVFLKPIKKEDTTKVLFSELPTVKANQAYPGMDSSEKEKRFQFEKENFAEETKEEINKTEDDEVKKEEVAVLTVDKEELEGQLNQIVDTVSGVTVFTTALPPQGIVQGEDIVAPSIVQVQPEQKVEKEPVIPEDQRPKRQRIVYHKMTLAELKALAKEMGMTGYSRLSKIDLIIRIKDERKKESKKRA